MTPEQLDKLVGKLETVVQEQVDKKVTEIGFCLRSVKDMSKTVDEMGLKVEELQARIDALVCRKCGGHS